MLPWVTGTSFEGPVVADVRKIKAADWNETSAEFVRIALTGRAHRSLKFDNKVDAFEASNKPYDPFTAAARAGELIHSGTISASKLNLATCCSNSLCDR